MLNKANSLIRWTGGPGKKFWWRLYGSIAWAGASRTSLSIFPDRQSNRPL